MDWKNQLTKTPYLVLFIVLISIGVGTASALITITLAGNVVVTGDLRVDGQTTGFTISQIENQLNNFETYVNRTNVLNHTGSNLFVTVKCSQGDVATGGGFILLGDSQDDTGKVTASEPIHITDEGGIISQLNPGSVSPNAWSIFQESTPGMGLQTFVVCLDITP